MKRIFKTKKQRQRDAKQLSGTRVGEFKLINGQPAMKWQKPKKRG